MIKATVSNATMKALIEDELKRVESLYNKEMFTLNTRISSLTYQNEVLQNTLGKINDAMTQQSKIIDDLRVSRDEFENQVFQLKFNLKRFENDKMDQVKVVGN